MVKNDFEIIPDLEKNLKKMRQINTSRPVDFEKSATLFFSLDIENSSMYKEKYPGRWSATLYKILQNIMTLFETSTAGGFDFWKALGDEVIYTKKVYKMQDIIDSLDEVYVKMLFLNESLSDGVICTEEEGQILAIKTTVWICELSTSSETSDNVSLEFQIKDNRKQSDVLGPDIDTGFRIAKYSMKNRIVISYKLAYIIATSEEICENIDKIKIIGFRSLKGVWVGKNPYPIILYHCDNKVSFLESISNSLSVNEEILRDYEKGHYMHALQSYEGYKSYEDKIIKELSQDESIYAELEQIVKTIDKQKSVFVKKTKQLQKFFCSIICYNIIDNQVNFVLAKKDGEEFWSIREVDVFIDMFFLRNVEDIYLDMFGIDLRIQSDSKFHEKSPLIAYSYTHEEEGTPPAKGNFLYGYTKMQSFERYKNYEFKVVNENDICKLTKCSDETKEQLEKNLLIIKQSLIN